MLVEWLGARGALVIAGAILPILAVATWPRVSRLDRESRAPALETDVLHAIPLFSPLPLTAIDRLAALVRPVAYPPGETIMRQGAPGDTYLAIASGIVTIEVDGRLVATCGPGEGIGEIALLRNVPRTATATASTAVTGFELAGADFLAAIAGPASTSAAETTVVDAAGALTILRELARY